MEREWHPVVWRSLIGGVVNYSINGWGGFNMFFGEIGGGKGGVTRQLLKIFHFVFFWKLAETLPYMP